MWRKISISRTCLSLATALTVLLALPAAATGSHTQSGTWLQPNVLGQAFPFACWPCEYVGAAMNRSGDAAAVWNGGPQWSVAAATRKRGGSWVAYPDISEGNDAYWGLQIEMDSAGNAYALWIADAGPYQNKVQAATYRPGVGWSPPAEITGPSPDYFRQPVLAVDSRDGSATAVWYQQLASLDIPVWSAWLAPGGENQWSAPQEVSPPDDQRSPFPSPDVGMDDAGNAIALWIGSPVHGSQEMWAWVATRPPGPQAQWTDRRQISPPGDEPEVDANDARPAISVNHAGEAAAVWVSGGRRAGGQAISVATRSDGKWSHAQQLPARDGAFSGDPKVAVDENGTATAAWITAKLFPWKVESSQHPRGGGWTDPQTVGRFVPSFEAPPASLADPYRSRYRPQISWTGAIPPKAYATTRTAGGSNWEKSELRDRGLSYGSEIAGDGQGDAVTILVSSNIGSPNFAQAIGYDDAGPQIDSVSVPCAGTVGEPVSFSVERTDVWSEVASDVWDFGDGRTGEGQQVEHTYQAAGTYDVTVTSTDSLGHPTTSPRQEIEILDPTGTKAATSCRKLKAKRRR